MTNNARGEVEVKLGGLTLTCCATMGAMARIEARLKKPTGVLLAEDLAGGSYTASLVVIEETALDRAEAELLREKMAPMKDVSLAAAEIFKASGMFGDDTGKAKPGKGKARS